MHVFPSVKHLRYYSNGELLLLDCYSYPSAIKSQAFWHLSRHYDDYNNSNNNQKEEG